MTKIRIIIADDHEIIHRGITEMLHSVEKYEIIGHAYNGKDAVDLCCTLDPDLIFIDLSMPVMSGLEAIKSIRALNTKIKIIALTQHDAKEYVVHVIKNGGHGYMVKNSQKEDFFEAIEAVTRNRRYISYELSEKMLGEALESGQLTHKTQEVQLTRREIEIIRKIAEDKSNQEIADDLNISLRTVETHRRNLMQKLNVKSVVAMLKYALNNRIIDF